MSNLKINFGMQIWGSEWQSHHLNAFLNVGLPSQLASNNIPFLCSRGYDILYEIYISTSNKIILENNPAFKELEKLVSVKFYNIDEIVEKRGKWNVVRHCHQAQVKSANERGAALFFLCPDQVWTNNSFKNAIARIEEGYSAVLCPGPRLPVEDCLPMIVENFECSDKLGLEVTPEKFVELGINNLHKEMEGWYFERENYWNTPPYIFFEVPGQGILAFCFILHPVVVMPEVRNVQLSRIFDQDYLLEACPNFERLYISQGSDDVFHFELSPKYAPIPPVPKVWDSPIKGMQRYAEFNFNSHHRKMCLNPIFIRYKDGDPNKLEEVKNIGLKNINEIVNGLKRKNLELLFVDPISFFFRLMGKELAKDARISFYNNIIYRVLIGQWFKNA